MAGDSYSANTSETDASTLISGNNETGGYSSADSINQQFFNVGSAAESLDLNSYFGAASSSFYNSLTSNNKNESAVNGVKYAAIAGLVVVSLSVVYLMKRGK